MKQIGQFIITLLLITCYSCNNHDERGLYTPLGIVAELEPRSEIIPFADMTPEERREYPRTNYVVNAPEDLPDDKVFGMQDIIAANVDFSRYTLLINYNIIPGYIFGHRYYWQYDNTFEQYELGCLFKASELDWDEESDLPEDWTYYRGAVIVNKISSNATVAFSYSTHND